MRNQARIFRSFKSPVKKFTVRIYLAHDIFSLAPNYYDYLINPSNEALVGTRLPYFPRGGPVPIPQNSSTSNSSRWGGMDAGEDMLYPVQTVDGLVHQESGYELLKFLMLLPEQVPYTDKAGQKIRCATGNCVLSPSYGNLRPYFGRIIHTVPPFYNEMHWESKLESCYISSFVAAWGSTDMKQSASILSVLLGSGCRGIPIDEAARIAASACRRYHDEMLPCGLSAPTELAVKAKGGIVTLRTIDFILREDSHCELLASYLSDEIDVF